MEILKPDKNQQLKIVFSSADLKLIALIFMIIDHIGAFILAKYFIKLGFYSCTTVTEQAQWIKDNAFLYFGYDIIRSIGRISFPIYCYLIVEGLAHTRSPLKYALRLLLFAFISEIPFDLAYYGKVFNFEYQNVFFTLFLGMTAIWAIDELNKKIGNSLKLGRYMPIFDGLLVIPFLLAAYFLETDYGPYGVLTIVVIYGFRNNRYLSIVMGVVVLCIMSLSELPALFCVPLIILYNGKKGMKLKYIFYIAYPAHLVIIYFVELWLKLIK